MAWVNTSPLVKTYTLEEFWKLQTGQSLRGLISTAHSCGSISAAPPFQPFAFASTKI